MYTYIQGVTLKMRRNNNKKSLRSIFSLKIKTPKHPEFILFNNDVKFFLSNIYPITINDRQFFCVHFHIIVYFKQNDIPVGQNCVNSC